MAGLGPAIHVFLTSRKVVDARPLGRLRPSSTGYGRACRISGGLRMKMWGRNTSSNVQKAMWAVGELKIPCERIDVGGTYGRTKEPFYLAMNPNALVPTLEEDDGFSLWESNSVVRYLAAKHGGTLEPKDPKVRAKAHQWMDWQLSVIGPAITPVFWGLISTSPEKRDADAIRAG